VSPIAGPGPLHGGRDSHRFTGREEGRHVLLPRLSVKVQGQEPTGLVREEWIHADDMATVEMAKDGLLVVLEERLIRALAALDARLLAHTAHPLVGAGRGVSLRLLLGVDPEPGEHVLAAMKELMEES
jgi:hypothetical protein